MSTLPVGELLHGRLPDRTDIAYSGVIIGVAVPALQPGVVASFRAADINGRGGLVAGVRAAALQVAGWLDGFEGTADAISFLTEDLPDRDPRVVFPAHEPVRLYVAAGLAVSDGIPGAEHLAERAIQRLAAFTDPTTSGRVDRLKAALA